MTQLKTDHLIGRPWSHGSTDCYGLARAFYADNYQIELPDMARPDEWWNSVPEGEQGLYMDHFQRLGFEVIFPLPRDIRIGDGFLMAVYRDGVRNNPIENRGRHANHSGVYVGDGKMLHHFHSRRSEIIPYNGLWKNLTVAIIRHKDIPAPEMKSNTVDFMSMISPELRRKIEPHVPASLSS
jgi:cell wall-associated NlpC family hydrolase